MEAGREMDALVAEKVMGCSVMRENYHRTLGDGGKWEWLRCGCIGGPHNYRDDTARDGMLVYYSTDISAAWEVVEKMGALGWKFGMVQDGTLWDVNTYNPDVRPSCAFCGHTPSGAINASAPTVPLAICRAALKAVEK